MKVAFVCDSGTGRNVAQLKELGIYSCPLQISDESTNYLELEDKSIEEIYDMVEKQVPLKTSLPPLGMIHDTIAQIKDDGYDTVFCVPICSGLSGTGNAFRLACEEAGLKFIFVDTHVTAEVEFYCVTQAKKMYEAGKSIDEILKELDLPEEAAYESSILYIQNIEAEHLENLKMFLKAFDFVKEGIPASNCSLAVCLMSWEQESEKAKIFLECGWRIRSIDQSAVLVYRRL